MEEMKNAHEVRMENYGDKLFDCDDKYSRVFATIRLNCEDSLRIYIKSAEDQNKMWNTLKRQYKNSDLVT